LCLKLTFPSFHLLSEYQLSRPFGFTVGGSDCFRYQAAARRASGSTPTTRMLSKEVLVVHFARGGHGSTVASGGGTLEKQVRYRDGVHQGHGVAAAEKRVKHGSRDGTEGDGVIGDAGEGGSSAGRKSPAADE
jgi:hypothetical protein